MTDNNFIELNDVSVTYSNGHTALSNINATLEKEHICGLVGVNGAGKSTLFKAIMGFEKPTIGTIKIMGEDVRTALKQNVIAYVPQTEEVDWDFPVLVEDVVMMGRYGHMGFLRRPSKQDKIAVDDALKSVDMSAYKKRQIGELSGGQKKRIFVARALAQNSKIILLDEPFTGVDAKTETSLIDLFRLLAKAGKLLLVSTHNLSSIPKFCDDVMMINKELIAYGSVSTTCTQENLSRTFGSMLEHHQRNMNNIQNTVDENFLSSHK